MTSAETERLSLPEGGFSKDLRIGTFLNSEGLVGIRWQNDKGGNGVMFRATSVKVASDLAGVKAAAA